MVVWFFILCHHAYFAELLFRNGRPLKSGPTMVYHQQHSNILLTYSCKRGTNRLIQERLYVAELVSKASSISVLSLSK